MQTAILKVDKWSVRELELTPEKLLGLWELLQRHKTLFSDLTKGDAQNFVSIITAPNSMWFEVVDYDVPVALIWFAGIDHIVDITAHCVFFDRQMAEKREVVRELLRWMFDKFPIQRITAMPPAMYKATVRLLESLGFIREGTKRQAIIIGGRWNDVAVYGLLRGEI